MSQAAVLYNPVPGGLSAQIWECLRRNNRFKASLADLICGTGATRTSARSELESNAFSRVVSGAVAQGIVGHDVVTMAWPTLPGDLRVKFDSLVADLRETPTFVHPPNFLDPSSPLTAKDQFSLNGFLRLWDKYEIVGLPRIVLDERHRRECKATAGSRVPRVIKFPLGAKCQWDTYLLMEEHEKSPHRDHARALAAWEHLEVKSYKRFSGGILSAKEVAEARRALSRQGKEFDKRIAAVEVAIEKVYPRFAVFGDLTQSSGEPIR